MMRGMIAGIGLAIFVITMSGAVAADANNDPSAKLAGTIVSFDFEDKPLEAALKEIAAKANVVITIDPAVLKQKPPAVNIRVKDMKADIALEWILKLAELECFVGTKSIFISTPDGIKAVKKESEKLQ